MRAPPSQLLLFGVVVALASILGWSVVRATEPAATVLAIDAGRIEGRIEAGLRGFLGIPYAKPPIGDLRWRSPQPPDPWRDVRPALEYGSPCAQVSADQFLGSEDCLYLNVFTPATTPDRPRPVMVWLHGGGLGVGSGEFDGRYLVERGDIVLVSINYRLGPFGQLMHPALDETGTGRVSGDATLEDQQAALHWVQRNIAAFGGDPGNVTIFGESGGGWAVCAQLASRSAAGLFHRAIVMSGPCTARWEPEIFMPGVHTTGVAIPMDEAAARGRTVAANLGCVEPADIAACLRAVPADRFFAEAGPLAVPGLPIGGATLPIDPQQAFASGEFNRVPVIMGTTRDEHRLFVQLGYDLRPVLGLSGGAIDAAVLDRLLTRGFGNRSSGLRNRYVDGSAPGQIWSSILTDSIWSCPTIAIARLIARYTPTYLYEFADQHAPGPVIPGASFPLGAYHSAELAYLLDLSDENATGYSPAQAALGRTMVDYWTGFARTGTPNRPGLPAWSPMRPGIDSVVALGGENGTAAPTPYWDGHQCQLWR